MLSNWKNLWNMFEPWVKQEIWRFNWKSHSSCIRVRACVCVAMVIFQSDGMFDLFSQGTIGINGLSMVLPAWNPHQFLLDPGVPGVQSMVGCLKLTHWETLCKLNWCDSSSLQADTAKGQCGNASGTTWRVNLEPMQVVPPSGARSTNCWPHLQAILVAPSGGKIYNQCK